MPASSRGPWASGGFEGDTEVGFEPPPTTLGMLPASAALLPWSRTRRCHTRLHTPGQGPIQLGGG